MPESYLGQSKSYFGMQNNSPDARDVKKKKEKKYTEITSDTSGEVQLT